MKDKFEVGGVMEEHRKRRRCGFDTSDMATVERNLWYRWAYILWCCVRACVRHVRVPVCV